MPATHILVGLATAHIIDCGDSINDNNYLVGIEHDKVFAATMVNSFERRSYILGKEYDMFRYKGVSVSSYLFAASGYRKVEKDFECHVQEELFVSDEVIIAASMNFTYRNVQLTVMPTAVNVGVKFQIDLW